MNCNNIGRSSDSIRATFGLMAGNPPSPTAPISLPELAVVKNRLLLASPILFLLGFVALVMAQPPSPTRLHDIAPMRGGSCVATESVPFEPCADELVSDRS